MSLTRSIAHNTAIQIIGKGVSTLLGLAAVAIMTRTLGVEKFGWYITTTGFLQFIGIISDFGFTVTTSNMLSEPAFDKKKLLNTIFTWRFLTALIFQGLAPLLILFFPYPREIKIAVTIITVSFFALALQQVFIGYCRAHLRVVMVTWAEILGRVALVIGVALAAWRHAGFLPMMAAITVASILSAGYMWTKILPIRFCLDRAISKALFYKMWPTALSVIFNAFYLQADRVILPLYVSQAEVGIYGAAYRVLDITIQIAAIVMGLIMPLITYAWSRNLKEEFARRYQLSFDLLCLILLPMIAGIVVLAQPIMRLIAGRDFSGAGELLKWLGLSIFGTCFGMVFGHIALAINRQKQALWIYASDAILSLIGYFIFIPRYGFWGAVGVTIFSEFYAGLGLAILTIYYTGAAPRLLAFLKIVVASVLMGLLVAWVQPLNIVFSILLGIAAYGALVLALRIISISTIKEVLSFKKVAFSPEN